MPLLNHPKAAEKVPLKCRGGFRAQWKYFYALSNEKAFLKRTGTKSSIHECLMPGVNVVFTPPLRLLFHWVH